MISIPTTVEFMSKAIGPGSEALVIVGFFDQVVHRIEGVIDSVLVGS